MKFKDWEKLDCGAWSNYFRKGIENPAAQIILRAYINDDKFCLEIINDDLLKINDGNNQITFPDLNQAKTYADKLIEQYYKLQIFI